ncbi:cation:proton antiporter [Rhodobacteraceae bacterium XHP0102]|nr:cation:proton antiporter [Rhodobacteraceae bacterium XHP0102]
MIESAFLNFSLTVSMVLLLAGLIFSFIRLVVGPTLPDRVVALDLMTVLIIVFCGIFAILEDKPAFLDVALVLALVGFLATVALARYVERYTQREQSTRAQKGQQ